MSLGEIAIRLDPRHLPNATTDLRYDLPDALAAACPEVRDDGYDYDDANRMLVFLVTEAPESIVHRVVEVLRGLELDETRFDGEGVEVGWAEARHERALERYRVVHPPGAARTLAGDVSSGPP